MRDAKPHKPFSDRAKHRLRIAARFMRQKGHRFANGEFYGDVLNQISRLDEGQQTRIRSLIDWIEAYEIAELDIYGEPTRSRARKIKTKPGRRRVLRAGVSDAKPEN